MRQLKQLFLAVLLTIGIAAQTSILQSRLLQTVNASPTTGELTDAYHALQWLDTLVLAQDGHYPLRNQYVGVLSALSAFAQVNTFTIAGLACAHPQVVSPSAPLSTPLQYIQSALAYSQTVNTPQFSQLWSTSSQPATCYQSYQQSESQLQNAIEQLNLYYLNTDPSQTSTLMTNFINSCSAGQCSGAIVQLQSFLQGTFNGCDLLQLLYDGDVNNDFWVGSRDVVDTKSSYVLALILQGIVAEAAYQTLNTGNDDSWSNVQELYIQSTNNIIQRIQTFDGMVDTNQLANAQTNTNRIITLNAQNAKRQNSYLSLAIGQQLDQIFPYLNWFVVVYQNCNGNDCHYLRTENGFVILHWITSSNPFGDDYGFNILVARAAQSDAPSPTILNSGIYQQTVGQYQGGAAWEVNDYVMRQLNGCPIGCWVMNRYINAQRDTYYMTPGSNQFQPLVSFSDTYDVYVYGAAQWCPGLSFWGLSS